MRVMWRIEDLAREGARGVLQGDNDVVAAWDLMLLQGELVIRGSDAALRCAALCCAVLCCAALCCAVLCCAALCCTALM